MNIYIDNGNFFNRLKKHQFSERLSDGTIHYQTQRRAYRRLSSAKCNAHQLFNTGYYPNNNTVIRGWWWKDGNDAQSIIGCGDLNGLEYRLQYSATRSWFTTTHYVQMGYGNILLGNNKITGNYSGLNNADNPLIFKDDNNHVMFDYTANPQTFQLEAPLYIGGVNVPANWTDQSITAWKGSFSDIQIWENDICMYAFVPAVDAVTGEHGILDNVRQEFYPNIHPSPQNFQGTLQYIPDDEIDENGMPRYGDTLSTW